MRVGLLADIHGNLHALRVATSVLAEAGTDRYVVAGDIVGYGPHPNECVTVVAALPGLVAVAGNHELLVQGALDGSRLPDIVRDSIDWTRDILSPESRRFLATLPKQARIGELAVTHGSLSSVSDYVSYPHQAQSELVRLTRLMPGASILVLGHTHIPWIYRERGGTARITLGSPLYLDPSMRHIVNPGSVGQSRVREPQPKARFAQLDLETQTVTFWALEYDHAAARHSLQEVQRSEAILHLKPSLVATAIRPLRQRLSRLRRRDTR